ncbi:MAG: sugar phosphate isomerase/epimerase [Planctomycetia bacterium]|nr:sugar phosphate isomerase/epimerase [Planctomycetia bacterium]
MFVSATTTCFRDLPLDQALEKLADLEYSNVELIFYESGNHLKPSMIADQLYDTAQSLKNMYRLVPSAISLEIITDNETEYLRQFLACCKLAKALKIVTVTLRAAEWGAPFNLEVERLQKCTFIASNRGITLGLLTERGRITEDVETVRALCKNVPGLHITLDPSHYIYGYKDGPQNYESLLDQVCHVHLRDTRVDKFQVCVGQGEIEYGRLLSQLQNKGYNRGLSVDIQMADDINLTVEMRKMRLLLESLLQ